ncbi:MAG: NUDIX domain-containing protein [Massiliimalia sp.]|jgi:isopentenyldiphosphate isomerase
MSDTITTYSKIHMNPLKPKPEDICSEDIAHALSQMTRANGHFPEFYSVAQHCLACAEEAKARGYSDRVVLACLLHDASEAYLSDITRPVKGHLPSYLEIEKVLQKTIYIKYLSSDLTSEEAQLVKNVDDTILYYEFLHYMGEKLMPKAPAVTQIPEFSSQPMVQVERQYQTNLHDLCQKLELFDLLDEQGNLTGQVKLRWQVHRDGDWHQTAHVWIARINPQSSGDDRFEILFQKRSLQKDSFPGCYDISSAGHIPAGSESLPSALRELEEELGIHAEKSQLHFCFRHKGEWCGQWHEKPFRNREYSHVYLYVEPVDISQLTLQPEEVSQVMWMGYESALKRIQENDPAFCVFADEFQALKPYLLNYLSAGRTE